MLLVWLRAGLMKPSEEHVLIDAYVDGRLDDERSREIERQAAHNPDLFAQIESCRTARALHQALIPGKPCLDVSPGLREAAENLFRRARARAFFVRLLVAGSIVAALFCGAYAPTFIGRREQAVSDAQTLPEVAECPCSSPLPNAT